MSVFRRLLLSAGLACFGCSPSAVDAVPSADAEAAPPAPDPASVRAEGAKDLDEERFHADFQEGLRTDPSGDWRFVLDSPGGPLPFVVELDGSGGGALVDSHERLPLSAVSFDDGQLRIELEHYDSVLEGKLTVDEHDLRSIAGTWRRRSPGKEAFTQMSFRASELHDGSRFEVDRSTLQPLSGMWQLTFSEKDGSTFAGLAELRTQDRPDGTPWIEGTILTDTGDYRYLEGIVSSGVLKLSVFDGAHAFLFSARLDGEDLVDGHFWSRDAYHATFGGEKTTSEARSGLADPFDIVELTSTDGRFHFDFPRLGGGRFTHDDPTLEGKVVIVEVFGSWCPNCNDQAPLMSQWYREYAPRGLEMVGIAFEFTGEPAKDMDMLGRYATRYAVEYPLLLGGTSDKKEAGKRVPDLSNVASYPTTIFIGRDGKVSKIYSGFSGPATGAAFDELKSAFRAEIEGLLAQK
jgi:thiol-disulfide isomerase/thioredoxin